MALESMTLTKALKTFCMLDSENTGDLMRMYKELTETDKQWFREQFVREGLVSEIVKAPGA